jgi:Zn-dependent protease
MGFHEAMHGFTAHWLGDSTAKDQGRLTLNPLKHIDIFTTVLLPVVLIALGLQPFFIAKPVPFNPERVKYNEFGVALIGIAGPLTNLLLAIVGSLVFHIFSNTGGSQFFNVMSLFIQVNLAFFVFNLIPFPPLDGSRVLYAFAPEPLQKIMYAIESAGFMVIIVFVLLIFPLISSPIGNIINSLYRIVLH